MITNAKYDMGQRFLNKWVYLTIIIMFLGVIIWGLTSIPVAAETDKISFDYFHENWTQIVDGESIPLENIKDFKKVSTGEALVFESILPDNLDNKILLFYSKNQETRCFVDGILIHEFTIQDNLSTFKTPGSAWNQIDFDCTMEGKTIRLEISSKIQYFNNKLDDIYYIDNIYVDNVRVHELWLRGVVSFCLLILVVISFTSALAWKNQLRKGYFLALGQFYTFILIYILAGLNFFDIFFGRPIISYFIEQFFTRLIPVSLIMLAINSTNRCKHTMPIKVLSVIAILNVIVPWILLFVFGISLLNTVFLVYIISALISVLILIKVVDSLINFKDLSRDEHVFLPLFIVVVGGVLDVLMTVLGIFENSSYGICLIISLIIFTITIVAIFARQDSKTATEKIIIEHSYNRLKNITLMQQINAHFIFNTLNTISAFCKINPATADRAIKIFASYLRSYISFIDKDENIPFNNELALVKNYLTLEKIRFENSLIFDFDIECEDFAIPPLSLQTIIENAVIHGIRKSENLGKIMISTRKIGDCVEITVIDNGVGFDTNAPIKESSVGISNIRKRVEVMGHGKITIESKIGKGTKVIMSIPLT